VQDLGLGFGVRRAADVGRAVAEIEADPSYGQRARAFAARLAEEDGAVALADAAESLAGSGPP
jgi:UDP:flavonoid glycosyltransferase YjiC (YdhE family)